MCAGALIIEYITACICTCADALIIEYTTACICTCADVLIMVTVYMPCLSI